MSADEKIKKVERIKFSNVTQLETKWGLYIPHGMVMKDTYQNNGGNIDYRYHIHDHNGYGEDQGFNCINFYCGSFELLEVVDYPY